MSRAPPLSLLGSLTGKGQDLLPRNENRVTQRVKPKAGKRAPEQLQSWVGVKKEKEDKSKRTERSETQGTGLDI